MTALLDIRDLHLSMSSFDGVARVLSGVSLTVNKGEIWGLVGETGCGKSVTGLSVSRLLGTPPARYTGGEILLDGTDVLTLDEGRMRTLRRATMPRSWGSRPARAAGGAAPPRATSPSPC